MKNNNYINESTDKEIQAFYLDWVNNYLTVDVMAQDYVLSLEETKELIDKGRELNNNNNKMEIIK